MRRTPVALIPLVVSAILAGCAGDQETTAPRTLVPRSSSSGNVLPLTCDANAISNISQDAKKYFPNGDPVFALITDMKNALKTSVAAATPKGFDILARTATVRRTAKQTGTNVQGGTFVLDVIACMSVGDVPDTFKPDQALGSGVFEVRTGGSSEGPTVAYNALTAKTTTVPSPEWGAERNSTLSTSVWPYVVGTNAASPKYLVYGYPLGTTGVVASGFELGTLPIGNGSGNPKVDINSNPLGVGICTASAVTDPTTGKKTANLLNHNGDVLNLQKLSFCSQTFTVDASGSWLRSLPGRLLAFVKPTTLFAQDEERGFVGGLPSGWSPNTVQSFINTDITVSYIRQPVDAKLKINLDTIVVEVATDAVMPPVNVRLTIANNSGTPAFLTDADSNDPSFAALYVDRAIDLGSCTKTTVGAVTHTTCRVTFRIGFTKAGGYTLNAAGYIGGGTVSTAAVISNLFNVKNQ